MSADRPVVGFDHHSKTYAQDPKGTYSNLHARCPIAWTEAHGGYWVVSNHDHVARVARDDDTFSSRHELPNDGKRPAGILQPPAPYITTPIEMDPPEFAGYRTLLNPLFAPAAVDRLKPRMREFTDWCLDRFVERGEIDFIEDLANPVPAMATMAFLGLPLSDWEMHSWCYHDAVAYPPGTPGWNRAVEGAAASQRKVAEAIADRRKAPRDDVLTLFTRVQVNGAPMSDATILEICNLIISGGVDTTTSLIGHALNHLDEHRDQRRRLIEDPELMSPFCEELLRYYTPTQALARTATRDVEVGGQLIRAGERVLMCWAGANRDETQFERPHEFVLDRFPNRHVAFGLGVHRCLGSTFARAEFNIVMQQVLARMPDYTLLPGARRYETVGTVNGWARMPARFTPGAKVGARAPFET